MAEPDIETYIKAAEQHGEDEHPDHEVGDLQDYLRVAWSLMTGEQRAKFAASADVRATYAHALGEEPDDEADGSESDRLA
jgi:hypothetical protein